MRENNFEGQREQIKLSNQIVDLEESFEELEEIRKKSDQEYKDSIVLTKKMEIAMVEDRIRKERFWNMLVSSINENNFEVPQRRNLRVLDLACSVCEEKEPINSFFGGSKDPYHINKNVELIGIDNDKKAIGLANEHIPKGYEENYKFIEGNATDLSKHKDIPNDVDVVILRHQQMFKPNYNKDDIVETELWENVFSEGLKKLNNKGVYIITSYTEEEHNQFLEFLDKQDCEIMSESENKFAEPLGAGGVDKYVIVIKKAG